jgi:uncharacterized protein
MRVTITGASGLIGSAVVVALLQRGDEVTVLSRDPARARQRLGSDVDAHAWQPLAAPAPSAALDGRDAVVNLAGEPVAQRWSARAREAIRTSRVIGTANLVEGLRFTSRPPGILLSGSASGYYGAHGEEPIDEEAPPGDDFLASVCLGWERAAEVATELGMRVVLMRTGVVLDRAGGALAKMLPPFRAGIGGPVASGDQYVPWIALEDVVGIVLAALDGPTWSGPVNASAPGPVTNRDFAQALGHTLRRPAILPVPAAALRLLYGDMAQIVIAGVRMLPARPLILGYGFRKPSLAEALRAALA